MNGDDDGGILKERTLRGSESIRWGGLDAVDLDRLIIALCSQPSILNIQF